MHHITLCGEPVLKEAVDLWQGRLRNEWVQAACDKLVPIPGQFMWDLQRREQHRGRFSSKYFDFPCECHSIHLPPTPYITLATDSVVTQNTVTMCWKTSIPFPSHLFDILPVSRSVGESTQPPSSGHRRYGDRLADMMSCFNLVLRSVIRGTLIKLVLFKDSIHTVQ
jgi:hypothetical protein